MLSPCAVTKVTDFPILWENIKSNRMASWRHRPQRKWLISATEILGRATLDLRVIFANFTVCTTQNKTMSMAGNFFFFFASDTLCMRIENYKRGNRANIWDCVRYTNLHSLQNISLTKFCRKHTNSLSSYSLRSEVLTAEKTSPVVFCSAYGAVNTQYEEMEVHSP